MPHSKPGRADRKAPLYARTWIIAATFVIPSLASAAPADPPAPESHQDAYFPVATWNEGLTIPPNGRPALETPREAMENLLLSVRDGDYPRAAWSLDLSRIPRDKQDLQGPRIAAELGYLIRHEIWFRWEELPDRPDGVGDRLSLSQNTLSDSGNKSLTRSLLLGSIDLDGRPVDIRISRIKPAGQDPVWVFSSRSVEPIDALYEAHGPSAFEKSLPGFLRKQHVFQIALWQWLGLILFLGIGLGVGTLFQRIVQSLIRQSNRPGVTNLARGLHIPLTFTIGLWVFQRMVESFLRLGGPVLTIVKPLIWLLIALGLVWTAQRLVTSLTEQLRRRYMHDDQNRSSGLVTRITVLKHVLSVAVLIVGVSLALSSFQWFRMVGLTLLGSAGVAGIILGISAQRTLGNLFSGVQLAITQPVVVGDSVLFEEDWGTVEEIAMTYLVIRTWDLRRIIVPLSYLVDHPIQNWSKQDESLIKPVYLKVDYDVDIEALRQEFERVLHDNDNWDGSTPATLQVTESDDNSLTLRASAALTTRPPPGPCTATSARSSSPSSVAKSSARPCRDIASNWPACGMTPPPARPRPGRNPSVRHPQRAETTARARPLRPERPQSPGQPVRPRPASPRSHPEGSSGNRPTPTPSRPGHRFPLQAAPIRGYNSSLRDTWRAPLRQRAARRRFNPIPHCVCVPGSPGVKGRGDERRHPSQVRRVHGHLRLRQHLHDPQHPPQDRGRGLRQVPPVLHRLGQVHRHRRPRRPLQPQVPGQVR